MYTGSDDLGPGGWWSRHPPSFLGDRRSRCMRRRVAGWRLAIFFAVLAEGSGPYTGHRDRKTLADQPPHILRRSISDGITNNTSATHCRFLITISEVRGSIAVWTATAMAWCAPIPVRSKTRLRRYGATVIGPAVGLRRGPVFFPKPRSGCSGSHWDSRQRALVQARKRPPEGATVGDFSTASMHDRPTPDKGHRRRPKRRCGVSVPRPG